MGKKEMLVPEIKLVRKESFSVIGESCLLAKSDHGKNDAFGKFANQFLANRSHEIRNAVSRQLYAINVYPANYTGTEKYEFICCHQVHDLDHVPEGMVARTFPAQEYAVVTHKGSLRSLPDSYSYFHSTWRSHVGYDYADSYDIQVYDARFLGPNHPDSELDIYVPVRRTENIVSHAPSPIRGKLQGAFIPVRNVAKAKQWYCRILGLPESGDIINGHLYALPLEGPAILLDEMPMWGGKEPDGPPPYRTPSLMIPTDNITEAYQFMHRLGVELVTEIMDGHWFVFRDPDGNMLMVCAV